MKQKLLSVFVLLLATTHFAYSQRTITGVVTSAKDKQPVIGAVVLVEKTTVGTTTDIDGKYSLTVPDNAQNLIVSYTGMKTKTVVITGLVLDVVLEDNEKVLGDVVVTALGIKREKKALGYASQEIKGDDINTAKDANLVNNLTGKIAGVQITGSSNLGGSSRITIRGIKSLTGENQPLFVIDGVVIDNSNFTNADLEQGSEGHDYGNAAQDINADDIETLNVLKGGPATALYGSRGANGVIVITTKRGSKHGDEKGKSPIGVTVTENMMFNQVSVLPDYQNQYGPGYGAYYGVDANNGQTTLSVADDASWGPRIDGRLVRQYPSFYASDPLSGQATPYVAHPNNVKDFFQTGYLANTNISLDGANDKGSFRASFSNMDQKGTVPNSSLQRNTISFNGGYNFNDKLFANVGASYVHSQGVGRPSVGYSSIFSGFTQWWERQLDINDLKNYMNPDGSQRTWNLYPQQNANGSFSYVPYYWDNPYWKVYQNYETDHRDRVFGNAEVGWKITKWLTAKGRFTTDFYNEVREERVAVGEAIASNILPGYSIEQISVKEMNYEGTLNAQKSFRDILDLGAMIGINRRDQYKQDNFSSTQGGLNIPGWYRLENSVDKVFVDNFESRKRVNSVFGTASLGVKHMVYIDFTARNDWSSTLPSNNLSYFYPSISGSFVFSELIKNKKVLSFGKIRGGWAKVGNDTDPYRVLTNPGVGKGGFGSSPIMYVPQTYNDPTLRPEKIFSWEIGTDLSFFEDRIKVDAAYYQSLTKDNIFRVQQTAASGIGYRYTNAGTLENKGVELAASFVPVRTKSGFSWTIGFNFGKNWNKVKELYTDKAGNKVTSLVMGDSGFGVTLEARAGQAYGQLVGTDFVYDGHGNKVVDATGNYLQTSTPQPLGSILPEFTGGVSTTLAYKGLSIFFLFDYQKGGNLFSVTNMYGTASGTLEVTAANHIREDSMVVSGVVQTGTDAQGNPVYTKNTQKISPIDFYLNGSGSGAAYGNGPAKINVYDASFVKWRELKIMYAFPSKMFDNTPIRGISIGIIARNLLILKKNVPNIDPEAATTTSNVQGIEGGAKPSERSIGFNVSVKF